MFVASTEKWRYKDVSRVHPKENRRFTEHKYTNKHDDPVSKCIQPAIDIQIIANTSSIVSNKLITDKWSRLRSYKGCNKCQTYKSSRLLSCSVCNKWFTHKWSRLVWCSVCNTLLTNQEIRRYFSLSHTDWISTIFV